LIEVNEYTKRRKAMRHHRNTKNLSALAVISVFFALFFSPAFAAEKLPTAPYLPLDMAQKIANAAMDKCIKDGYRVSVAIVARSGETWHKKLQMRRWINA